MHNPPLRVLGSNPTIKLCLDILNHSNVDKEHKVQVNVSVYYAKSVYLQH